MATETRSTNPRPAMWHSSAEAITAKQAADTAKHVTLADVCNRTGLRQITITHAIARRGPFVGDRPVHALARPAYLVGSSGEPRWSEDQLRQYWEIEANRARTARERFGHLEVVTDDQARERGLVNLRTIHRITGYALSTLHRWTERADFPPLVAVNKARGPQPRLLREWGAVRGWLLHQHPDVDYPETVPDDAWKPVATSEHDFDDREDENL